MMSGEKVGSKIINNIDISVSLFLFLLSTDFIIMLSLYLIGHPIFKGIVISFLRLTLNGSYRWKESLFGSV